MRGDIEKLQGRDDDCTDKPDSPLFNKPTTHNLLLAKPTTAPSFTRKIFLFEIRLTPEDMGQARLFIPVEITIDNDFPPPPPKHSPRTWEKMINISDAQGRVWPMKMRYNHEECTFLIDSEWWLGFALSNDLKTKDVIRFYRPFGAAGGGNGSQNNHYLIEKHAKLRNQEEGVDERFPATFMREKFEFQWLVSGYDLNFGSMILDEAIVRTHFRAVRIPTRGAETPRHVERLYFTDPQNREWCMKIKYHMSGTYMIEWGEYVKEHNVEAGDVIRFYRPPFQRFQPLTSRHFLIEHLKSYGDSNGNLLLITPKPTKVFQFKLRNLLFQMRLTPSEVDMQGRLLIPVEIALDSFRRFLRLDYKEEEEMVIKITTDTCNWWWSTKIKYDPEDCVFVIEDWLRIAEQNNLKARDVIRFYKPFPRADDDCFLIEPVFRRITEESLEFKQENFLFQKQLTLSEVGSDRPRLSLSKEQVRRNFPAVGIPAETHELERLYFTDAKNMEWCCKIRCFLGTFFLESGWEEFVKEYKVEIGDVIRFYKPVLPLDSRHLLIRHVREIDEASGSSNHPLAITARDDERSWDHVSDNESTKNSGIEGVGEDRNRGGENQQEDSSGHRSDSDSSRKKGTKKFGGGGFFCCFRA
ncbi:hypothetical protein Vadar_021477 [Vaccinium darrowii]|uniref:Uncharacterized protein n=1 Tax=Vaccinium darrowii TaxID=229202 RepID=A0ACB7XBV8_9ERIC|nr:hypothetical protein Vadar_021477 [Vaccinium darrowii]